MAEAIQRTLHTQQSVPVYAVPPLAPNTTGYKSSQWLQRPPMFTATLEVVETSSDDSSHEGGVTVAINLQDPTSKELFASAPYTHTSVITPCADSRRYFAIRVADETGRKATLGIGFESRDDAFELVAILEDARKLLGFHKSEADRKEKAARASEEQRQWKLKEGESMNIDVMGLDATARHQSVQQTPADDAYLIRPPPAAPMDNVSGGSGRDLGSPAVYGDVDNDFGDFQ